MTLLANRSRAQSGNLFLFLAFTLNYLHRLMRLSSDSTPAIIAGVLVKRENWVLSELTWINQANEAKMY